MPGDAPAPDLATQAAAWLDLAPESSSAATRAALLRRLRAANFLPDPATHEAILIAAGQPIGAAPHLAADIPSGHWVAERAVRDFAAEFFRFPLAARREHWEALRREVGAFPALRARVDQLEPGLAIDPERCATISPGAQWLARDIMTLFIAPPEHRPAWLREMAYLLESRSGGERRQQARARRDLTRQYPELATLGADYLAAQRPAMLTRRIKARLHRVRRWYLQDLTIPRRLRFWPRRGGKPAAKLRTTRKLGNLWIILVLVSVTTNAVRMGCESSTPRSTPPPPPPAYAPIGSPPTATEDLTRHRLRESLRRDLDRLGVAVNDAQLDRVATTVVPRDPMGRALAARFPSNPAARLTLLTNLVRHAGWPLTPEQVATIARNAASAAEGAISGRPSSPPAPMRQP